MGIDRRFNGIDLLGDELWLEARDTAPRRASGAVPRIGVEYAGAWALKRWRFFERGSPYVSRRPAARAVRGRCRARAA